VVEHIRRELNTAHTRTHRSCRQICWPMRAQICGCRTTSQWLQVLWSRSPISSPACHVVCLRHCQTPLTLHANTATVSFIQTTEHQHIHQRPSHAIVLCESPIGFVDNFLAYWSWSLATDSFMASLSPPTPIPCLWPLLGPIPSEFQNDDYCQKTRTLEPCWHNTGLWQLWHTDRHLSTVNSALMHHIARRYLIMKSTSLLATSTCTGGRWSAGMSAWYSTVALAHSTTHQSLHCFLVLSDKYKQCIYKRTHCAAYPKTFKWISKHHCSFKQQKDGWMDGSFTAL